MFISKANPRRQARIFSGFNIYCCRNQKLQRLTYRMLSVFALKKGDKAWTEGRPDEIKLFILQIQLRIMFPAAH